MASFFKRRVTRDIRAAGEDAREAGKDFPLYVFRGCHYDYNLSDDSDLSDDDDDYTPSGGCNTDCYNCVLYAGGVACGDSR